MALPRCPPQPELIISESALTDWKVIGVGGFGQVNRVRHRQWCFDVAVKLLQDDDGNSASLLREVRMLREGSCPYVIQVLGLFQGQTPTSRSVQLGLVMELMERGSLATLQDTLLETPPWPLAFRLAYQVALGINFLHSRNPPLLHLDLKPSNVLLDSCLNAKLADFGLSKFYSSITQLTKKDGTGVGTTKYMPPEAFSMSYKPKQASDIYSYGILLWSIATWKKPYEYAMSCLVQLKIPQDERPPLDEISKEAPKTAGLSQLINLMKKCWEGNADQRPLSLHCAAEAEGLFNLHKRKVADAVYEVLRKMDANEELGFHHHGGAGIDVPTGNFPIQEEAGGRTRNQRTVAKMKDRESAHDIDIDSAPSSANPTSADPLLSLWPSAQRGSQELTQQALKHTSPHPLDTVTSCAGAQKKAPSHWNKPANGKAAYERQLSSPDTPFSNGRIIIHNSKVTGVQQGNNNVMNINSPQRKRHPTAPGRVPPKY